MNHNCPACEANLRTRFLNESPVRNEDGSYANVGIPKCPDCGQLLQRLRSGTAELLLIALCLVFLLLAALTGCYPERIENTANGIFFVLLSVITLFFYWSRSRSQAAVWGRYSEGEAAFRPEEGFAPIKVGPVSMEISAAEDKFGGWLRFFWVLAVLNLSFSALAILTVPFFPLFPDLGIQVKGAIPASITGALYIFILWKLISTMKIRQVTSKERIRKYCWAGAIILLVGSVIETFPLMEAVSFQSFVSAYDWPTSMIWLLALAEYVQSSGRGRAYYRDPNDSPA